MKAQYLYKQLRKEKKRIWEWVREVSLSEELSAATIYALLKLLGVGTSGRDERDNVWYKVGGYRYCSFFGSKSSIYDIQIDYHRIDKIRMRIKCGRLTEIAYSDFRDRKARGINYVPILNL
jgi:hypothetical protein